MAFSENQLLINLAIIKVNWDRSEDILSNFMPLVGYAIKQLRDDIVSIDELKRKIEEVAQFRIPSGALEVLVRRASRPKYGYVRKSEHMYMRVPDRLKSLNFETDRDALSKSFAQLLSSFNDFCRQQFGAEAQTENQLGFYEILYEVAPHVMGSASERAVSELHPTGELDSNSIRYRTARYISHILQTGGEELDIIESFFQGAVLAESFYYTNAETVQSKIRDLRVYYDTTLLSHILGYTTPAASESAQELHKLVHDLKATTAIFDHTFDELIGIFNAAAMAWRTGRARTNRPGDIFDWLHQNGYSHSDIELEIARLPEKLENLEIKIRPRPPHVERLGIDEHALRRDISEEILHQSDAALNHDIDAVSSVYRLRDGKPQKFLESSKAIFVTTNSALARAATHYFNREHGISDAPICITSHIICMLLWLKITDKRPNVPKEILVANCVAALTPTRELWDKYINEVEKLRSRGDISEKDYILLSYSFEARQALMDVTEGEPNTFVGGTVVDVLTAARDAMTAEARAKIEEQSEEIRTRDLLIEESNRQFLEKISEAELRADSIVNNLQLSRDRVSKLIYTAIGGTLTFIMFIIFGLSQDGRYYEYIMSGKLLTRSWESFWPIVYLIALLAGVTNMIFGWSLRSPLRRVADNLASRLIR